MAHLRKEEIQSSNLDVDYVINFRYAKDTAKSAAQFQSLCRALVDIGLDIEARDGDNGSILLFTKVESPKYLAGEVYRSRIKDWLYGIRLSAPETETRESLDGEPVNVGERLRVVYLLITSPPSEGGAGVTPGQGQWDCVESVFALHDHDFNKRWMKTWNSKYFLDTGDLTDIRNHHGEKIGFYFAFLQSYFRFLAFPAIFGASTYYLLPNFSVAYGLISSLWSVVFLEYWKREETDLAVQWGVRGVSAINFTRPGFKETKEIQDPVTGETIKWFSPTERLKRQLLQLPLALVSGLALGGLIAACFGIEVFISEVYTGRFKGALIYLPTAILITALPALQTTLGVYAGKLTDYENYQTEQEHERAMVQKTFVFNFITSYLGIFLTAFVYVPFGAVLVPYLNVLSLVAKPFVDNEKHLTASRSSEFHINQNRLRKQVIYFTVTAQIINTITEVILPMIQRRGLKKYQEIKNDRASSQGGAKPPVGINDKPEEASFLARVRTEAALPAYDVNEDLREMVMQFGYLTLFSVVWPLTAVSFLINNWIELRSDALKISMEMQRPIPWRADSIGPWLENLGFLAWLGSITTGALVSLFSSSDEGPDGSPSAIKTGGLLLSILLSEHCYFGAKFLVRQALAQIESPGLQKERRERFTVRKRYLEESLGERAADLQARPRENAPIQVTRQSLEDEARVATTRRVTQADNFWGRQTGWQESVRIGEMIMQRNLGTLGSKKAR